MLQQLLSLGVNDNTNRPLLSCSGIKIKHTLMPILTLTWTLTTTLVFAVQPIVSTVEDEKSASSPNALSVSGRPRT